MKKIMIVPELPCKNCHKYESNACVECFNINGKKEQVPINWEDLKELCKELKEHIIWNKNYCEIKNFKISKDGNIYYRVIQIYSDETITKNYIIVINNRTIPQLWAFIKSITE